MSDLHNQQLFRQQAIDAQFFKQHGKAMILPSKRHSASVGLIFIWTCACAYFISTQHIADSVNVVGWIDTKNPTIDIYNQSSAGVVSKIYVENGQTVESGQKLALIMRSEGETLGQNGRKEWLDAIEQEQNTQLQMLSIEHKRLKNKLTLLQTELDSVNTQKQALTAHQSAQLSLDEALAKRAKMLSQLQEKGSISQQQIEQHQIQSLTLKQASLDSYLHYQQLEEREQQLKAQIQFVRADVEEISSKETLALLASDAKKRQAKQSNEFLIRAPKTAQVDNVLISNGEYVGFQQALMQLNPKDNEFVFFLAVSADQVSNIKLHQTVNVSVDGYAYQRFGFLRARVVRISNKVLLAKQVAKAPINIQQAVYLLELELTDTLDTKPEIHLRPGMTVQASVYTHEQSILQWLLQPLLRSIEKALQGQSTSGDQS